MFKYSLKRLSQSLVTLLIVVTAVFLLMLLLPIEGYFADGYDKLDPIQRENVLAKMGLLDPWYVQLGKFYGRLARGDLGTSIIYRRDVPITEVIAPRIPYSMAFGITATVLSPRSRAGGWASGWRATRERCGTGRARPTSSSSTPYPRLSIFCSYSCMDPTFSGFPFCSTNTGR